MCRGNERTGDCLGTEHEVLSGNTSGLKKRNSTSSGENLRGPLGLFLVPAGLLRSLYDTQKCHFGLCSLETSLSSLHLGKSRLTDRHFFFSSDFYAWYSRSRSLRAVALIVVFLWYPHKKLQMSSMNYVTRGQYLHGSRWRLSQALTLALNYLRWNAAVWPFSEEISYGA